jgi:predicted metal-dependent enzyme (double-stranded beta helix superfamily)
MALEGEKESGSSAALCENDAEPLGRDTIHSVTNPIARLTSAIHVYGGDFFAVPRSEWDPESLLGQRCDVDRIVRQFEESNTLYGKTSRPSPAK